MHILNNSPQTTEKSVVQSSNISFRSLTLVSNELNNTEIDGIARHRYSVNQFTNERNY